MSEKDEKDQTTERYVEIINHNYLVDPEMPQIWYDQTYQMLIMRNYTVSEAREAEVQITTDVMVEHVDTVLRYPDLFS